jgi:hypothetical protein
MLVGSLNNAVNKKKVASSRNTVNTLQVLSIRDERDPSSKPVCSLQSTVVIATQAHVDQLKNELLFW